MDRWREYYSVLLNRPHVAPSPELIEAARVAMPDVRIDISVPMPQEVVSAIHKLRSGTALGVCGITSEMLKAGGGGCTRWLTRVFEGVWKSGVIPEDWKRGLILPFDKGKGSKSDCKNYRGITLLSVLGEAFANILLGRVRLWLTEARRGEQSSFTPGRSTTDRILALNVLMQTRNSTSLYR